MPGSNEKDISNPRTGLIVGSGGPSTKAIVAAADTTRDPAKGRQAHRPVCGAQGDVVHLLGQSFHLVQNQGRELFHLVGLLDLGQLHRQRRRNDPMGQAGHDVRRRRRGTRLDAVSELFDAMGAMSSKYNATPEKASRAYDKNRDGFVISGGGGILVLEELEHAKARGAKIYAELVGYGATADGADMVAPSGEGAVRCMQHGAASTSRRRSTTSIRTPPRRRWAIFPRSTRSAKCSATTCRRSAPPNRSPATARARPACMRRSTRF